MNFFGFNKSNKQSQLNKYKSAYNQVLEKNKNWKTQFEKLKTNYQKAVTQYKEWQEKFYKEQEEHLLLR